MMKKRSNKWIGYPAALTARRPGLKWCAAAVLLLFSLGLLYAVQWITVGNPLRTLLWILRHPGPSLFTVLALTLLQTVLWALTGSVFAAGLLTAIPAVLLALVNYFKLRINTTPVELGDFALVGKLPELSALAKGNLELPPRAIGAIALCVMLLLVTLWLDRALRPGWRHRTIAGAAALLVLLGTFATDAGRHGAVRAFGMLPDSRIGQPYSNEVNGLLGGLFRSWALVNGTAPQGYDADYMERILAGIDVDAAPPEAEEKPSVILILSEAFFDMTRLPQVTYSQDPLPVFRDLSRQTVSGTFYTSYCGYNTGIIERSVLTGLHSRYLPYGVNTCYLSPEDTVRLKALPALFRENGYATLALHTYNNELYNRTEAFPLLGFDRVLFEDDFYDETRLKGGYLSDDYFADLLIENYEAMTAEGKPAFLFGISMENHQPFPADKFDQTEISVTSPLLTEQELAALETVAQGVYDADASLGKLVEYFSQREDKVILVFFGDHRPSLPSPYERSIYQNLGICGSNDEFYWTPEEKTEMFSTDYLAWANYEAFDPADFGRDVPSGDMMLGSDILDWAGLRQTVFWHAVRDLSDRVCSYTEYCFVAPDGSAHAEPSGEAAAAVSDFSDILYDTFYGERYITDALNTYR